MKSVIITLLLLFCYRSSHAQVKNPFAALKYDSMVMYDYEPKNMGEPIILNGQFGGSIKKRVALPAWEISSVTNMLGQASSYGYDCSRCFNPHLDFVFYKNGKVAGHISVCMDCQILHSSPEIENRNPCISSSLLLFFNDLVKKYHFSHSIN